MTNPPSMTVTLRDASSADALCLAALGMQVFLDTYATQGIRQSIAREALEAFSPANFAQLLIEPTTFIVVAESQGHLIGFAQVALRTDHAMLGVSTAAELQRLYVQERFTGRGAGRLLLEAAERRATVLHASLLWATVWVGNPRALAFYPRQGYAWKGTPHYVFQGETHENHLFAKPLMTSD
ncbi:GNAT family N-acetyltransferase [Pseudomonas syringae]|uniref:GNAT family N-acetyltransferase n=1 Tax=Pseudomonas syringae TaxID=317 RepID=UPI0018E651BC|nr:GNAT family N-acetyltransferase [Pseudomonas syringae]MBI6741060.1 GNAT family N-acetyltransferase [Pseudomonas syringae]MBI6746226.1 GNAT family N-acetyltransferase [Pseudomonas syringae]MBI6760115.1 GNAT family N-acetyltransferase [Pseudomonas syringae]MBI6764781.1 GNAT family N-acetyltransferase [Pseudomonas syringae]MBI6784345.1 GNAT family N-acetyltransferase [Pseudomonas syringae]